MSFTDQKRRIADEETCGARWGGAPPGKRFRCCLCGHKFVPGDGWRWVYAGGTGLLNYIVCDDCDDDDEAALHGRMWERRQEFESDRFWWFREHCQEGCR